MTIETARILVVSRTPDDRTYMEDFFNHMPFVKPDFEISKFVPSDKYDFIIFDCRSMPIYKVEEFTNLSDEIQQHYFLLDRYIQESSKFILFFGKYYHRLNQERCPSANSKFTLFARIRELIDFINSYKN